MKTLLRSRDGASKGAALMIVLALVVLLTGVALAYFSRTTTDRQLAQSSYNDTSADLLARSALDIVVGDLKQEIFTNPTITRSNIQPSPYPIPTPSDIFNLIRYSSRNATVSQASNVSSTDAAANGHSISTSRWNSHYLVPRGSPSNNATDSSPVPSFTAPDWVLVTGQGPAQAPAPSAVIGRYAFAVYDEGGLLDMSLAGYPSWSGNPGSGCNPSPTPWLINVGRKGIMAFADLTALPTSNASPAPTFPPSQVDNIVGWRNYAMTQRTFTGFPNPSPSPIFGVGDTNCTKQDWYGSYLLYFGDPPFTINSLSDKLNASLYPFTATSNYMYPTPAPLVNSRTDQALTSRQQLLQLRNSLGFSQNVLQYMGTFSRERNGPAPDWPGLNGSLSEGRFNLNNLAMLEPNPADCVILHGKKKGWQTGKNKNHLCGTLPEIVNLFGLFWIKSDVLPHYANGDPQPGYWKYIGNVSGVPDPNGTPDPHGIGCFRGPNEQNDFFQILNYALNRSNCAPDGTIGKTFALGASLIDQYDSGDACPINGSSTAGQPPGCDLDSHVISNWNKEGLATHTTVIQYGHNGNHNTTFAYGMEPNYSSGDHTNGDDPWQGACTSGQGVNGNPHRPCLAPAPGASTRVLSHPFSNVGELGYGIDTSTAGLPTLNFSSPSFSDAPVLDFFSYNPISSVYPRAGIVNLYTRNAPVLAAILAGTLQTDAAAANPNPTPVVSQALATNAANAIVTETRNVLAGSPAFGPVTQTDLTRAIAARLVAAGATATGWTGFTIEQKQSIARALAEMGQTRTWNLFIDVIAQTGKYKPNASGLTGSNFVVEGEKRYWLHISLGRDLVQAGGTPCAPGVSTGCQVDVLGTQLEEVVE